jgi:hypothetical protein
MRTFKANWDIDPAVDLSHKAFVEYLKVELGKLGLSENFVAFKDTIIFKDSKQQFLYELHGGAALYARLRDDYLHWQEQLLAEAMAEEIQKEIDREILDSLYEAANNAKIK